MSKIAEKIHNVALQKAEEYSKTHGHTIIEEVAYGRGYKTAYIECYDQAIQDFLEKAEKFFNEELFTRFNGEEHRVASNNCMNLQKFIEQFKNYMQNE